MTRTVGRIAFAAVVWLFLIGIVVQVFLAGVGLFVPGVDMFAAHRTLGYMLHISPVPILLLAWAAGADRRTIWLSVALLAVVAIQPLLPSMRVELPVAAALHPVLALFIFGLTVVIARRSLALARSGPAAVPAAPSGPSPAASETPASQ